jgi:peptidoglycan/LPS O-acetylase OafA/YrhL
LKKRIQELDALRGIAALAVVLFHYTMYDKQANRFFNAGIMGVDQFFIISGFVIIMTIEKIKGWKEFLLSRFSRLYPAYWTCVTITTIFIIFQTQSIYFIPEENQITNNLLIRYVFNLTMVQNYLKAGHIDATYWTLLIELIFYFFMLLVLLTKNTRHIEKIGLICLLFSSLYISDDISHNVIFYKMMVFIPLISFFPLFYGGIILYKMKFEKITTQRMILFLGTMVIQCLMFHNCYRNNNYVSFNEYIIALSVIYSLFLFFLYDKLAFIVNPLSVWLGQISYSLYLIHYYLGTVIIIPGLMAYFKLNIWASAFIALCVALTIAHLVNKYIEQPAMKYLRKR